MSNSNQPFNGNNEYNAAPVQEPVQNPAEQPAGQQHGQYPPQPGAYPPPYGQGYAGQPGGYPQQNPQTYGGQPTGGYPLQGYAQQPGAYRPPYQQGYGGQPGYPAGMPYMPMIGEKEFIEKYAPHLKKNFNAVAIALYCLLGIGMLGTVVLAATGMGSWAGLADYVLILGLLIPFHITKKMGWSIGLLIFGILEVVVFLVMYQFAGGLGWLVGGIVAVCTSAKCRRQYKAFLAGDPYYYTR